MILSRVLTGLVVAGLGAIGLAFMFEPPLTYILAVLLGTLAGVLTA